MHTDAQELAAIAYVSTAAQVFTEEALEALLLDARTFNVEHAVTGVLLFDEGNFFQYLEGPRAGLMLVYERIRASRQHFGLIEILNRKVPERQFRDWSMGFTRAPKRVMLQLSQASWSRIVADIKGRPSDNSGLGMLAAFWNQASGREGR